MSPIDESAALVSRPVNCPHCEQPPPLCRTESPRRVRVYVPPRWLVRVHEGPGRRTAQTGWSRRDEV